MFHFIDLDEEVNELLFAQNCLSIVRNFDKIIGKIELELYCPWMWLMISG